MTVFILTVCLCSLLHAAENRQDKSLSIGMSLFSRTSSKVSTFGNKAWLFDLARDANEQAEIIASCSKKNSKSLRGLARQSKKMLEGQHQHEILYKSLEAMQFALTLYRQLEREKKYACTLVEKEGLKGLNQIERLIKPEQYWLLPNGHRQVIHAWKVIKEYLVEDKDKKDDLAESLTIEQQFELLQALIQKMYAPVEKQPANQEVYNYTIEYGTKLMGRILTEKKVDVQAGMVLSLINSIGRLQGFVKERYPNVFQESVEFQELKKKAMERLQKNRFISK